MSQQELVNRHSRKMHSGAPALPPLEHGDRLTREEFLRRWEAMPRLKHAERIGGRVMMSASLRPRRALNGDDPAIPPLENGDVLSRDEFRRRWANMSSLKRAERFDGSVFMQAAVRFREHGQPHQDLQGWLMHYKAFTPGVEGADNATLEGPHDDPQPDCSLIISPECGGSCEVNDEGYLVGAPEFLAEIAASSASFDLHEKFDSYQRSGVREYLVWKVLERAIVWFVLDGDHYRELPADPDGIHRSLVFPGLWLETAAIIAGDLRRVLEVLQQGLQSAEHTAFAQRLQAARHN